jgi:hypothetical protein
VEREKRERMEGKILKDAGRGEKRKEFNGSGVERVDERI